MKYDSDMSQSERIGQGCHLSNRISSQSILKRKTRHLNHTVSRKFLRNRTVHREPTLTEAMRVNGFFKIGPSSESKLIGLTSKYAANFPNKDIGRYRLHIIFI